MTDESLKMPKMDMKDVDLGNSFQQFLGVIKLDSKVIQQVAKNEKGNVASALFLLVGLAAGPVASAIFGYRILGEVFRPDITSTLISIAVALVSALIGFFITALVATKLFKGKGTFVEYFRVAGLAYGLNVLNIVSSFALGLAALIGFVVGIWLLVVGYKAIKAVFQLDDTNAVLTIVVTIVAMFIVGAFIATLGLTGVAMQSGLDLSSFSFS